MSKSRVRLYADTSVFGGCFDEEFAEPSRTLFDQVRRGRFVLVTSAIVEAEVGPAPTDVRKLFQEVMEFAEPVDVADDSMRLQQAYLAAGIVSDRSATDALHVALATIACCGVIASWNFRHIVHFDKIALYNAVNVLNGYSNIAIHAPHEVIRYEDEDF